MCLYQEVMQTSDDPNLIPSSTGEGVYSALAKKLSSVHWCVVFVGGVQYFGDSFCILGKEWECTIQS